MVIPSVGTLMTEWEWGAAFADSRQRVKLYIYSPTPRRRGEWRDPQPTPVGKDTTIIWMATGASTCDQPQNNYIHHKRN
jgi:hypothetical protein